MVLVDERSHDDVARFPITKGLAGVLWFDDDLADPQRPTRRQLAEAVVEHASGGNGPFSNTSRPETKQGIGFICQIADQIDYLVQHRHSIAIPSAARQASREAVPSEFADLAACIEDLGWERVHGEGPAVRVLQKIVEDGGARIAAAILRLVVREGLLKEI
jgi:hypothetical protein